MKSVIIGDATLYLGDCLDVMRLMPENSVDSIVTDPPYELGFMGKKWDSSGIAYSVEMWAEALRVLRPGGHLLAFSGARTYHRMVCAIEDSGFEVRDQIMWVYGSGMPKSRNVAKYDMNEEDAAVWTGWGTGLKPSHEPIVVARKALAGTVATNLLEYGVGAYNIDSCRLADGRWPANIIHDGSPEVIAAFPETSAQGSRKKKDCPSNTFGGGSKESTFYGDGGNASRFFYCAKASKADRSDGNDHPTVKPTGLMAYLIRLVTPPHGLVLDPFTGSGSTGKAAVREGFRFIGCDLSDEYIKIASDRITIELSKPQEQIQDSLI